MLAHPDDESLACGGTLALCAGAGVEATLVCATRGHAGHVDAAGGVTREALPHVRERELREAAAILGVARVEVLDHRDGLLPWRPAAPVFDDLRRVVRDVRPHAVITFGEDGLYWHPDHMFIARQLRDVIVAEDGAVPCALYGVTLARGAMRRLVDRVRAEVEGVSDTLWGVEPDAFGLHAAPPTVTIDVRPVIERKVRALRCHRSQLPAPHPLAHLSEELAAETLGDEYFHLLAGSPLSSSFLDELASRAAPG